MRNHLHKKLERPNGRQPYMEFLMAKTPVQVDRASEKEGRGPWYA